jgi:hypothetical protein
MALTQVDQGLLGTYAQYTGFKNRLINGAMVIAQRGTAAVTGNVTFPVDRWQITNSSNASVSAQQDSDVPTGQGFSFSAKYTVTTADASVTGTEDALFRQLIEGFNTFDFSWGTASAKTVTLSFWVRSSVTGTFGGALKNSGNTRSYPFTYTISSANTWEQKSVTIAGETTGTWLTDNGIGVRVVFSLGSGSDRLGTAGAWGSANYDGATGQTQLISTLNATWYITGVQLEKGSTATSFDYRPYGTELALCQRYYFQTQNINNNTQFYAIHGYVASSNTVRWFFKIPVPMRTTPSIALNPVYNTGNWYANLTGIDNFSFTAAPSIGNYDGGLQLSILQSTSAISASYYTFNVILYPVTGVNTNNFQISAEL